MDYTRVELDDELLPALHEEIARLPAKFRLPIVLCYLEGWTHTQAAVELQCGEATLPVGWREPASGCATGWRGEAGHRLPRP